MWLGAFLRPTPLEQDEVNLRMGEFVRGIKYHPVLPQEVKEDIYTRLTPLIGSLTNRSAERDSIIADAREHIIPTHEKFAEILERAVGTITAGYEASEYQRYAGEVKSVLRQSASAAVTIPHEQLLAEHEARLAASIHTGRNNIKR